MRPLIDILQIIVCIRLADATGYIAIFSQCILNLIANHHIVIFSILRLFVLRSQVLISHRKCMAAIIIIRIDDRKRSVYHATAAQHCMPCSPWLYASVRNRKSIRKRIQILVNIRNLHLLRDTRTDPFAEQLLIFLLYNKNHFLESGTHRVIDRKIDNNMTVLIDRVDLLHSAIAASHSCRHYYQNRFLFFHNDHS